LKDKRKKVILITSSVSNEGKSFTSLNLAAVYAIPGKKVALLEFDIRKPDIHSLFNFDNSIGLTSYLTGDVTCLSDICQVHNDIPDLHVYPAGPVPLNPADILSSEKMAYLFECLKEQYDYVIVRLATGIISE
jgi:capsular exopolysaccharide synthesis family protein